MNNSILDVFLEDPDKATDKAGLTLREYLVELLATLWTQAEGFSGKRPFGDSGWQFDVYAALIRSGRVEGKLDENGYLEEIDVDEANQMILEAIRSLR